ncbi:hypothetical protein [Pseudoclavibacter helvolus]|uniref:hypothetical protein n=1 Tax=Pseudoclavibacter helvolus TaxID=255205 RepID=UPI003C756490
MNEPIDHAAEARTALAYADEQFENGDDEVAAGACALAAAHAALALAAAQDRANELKRIEILVALSYGGGYKNPDASSTSAEVAAWDELHDPGVEGYPLAPSIARSLGLGGESDGDV